jgi:hypothetical protein
MIAPVCNWPLEGHEMHAAVHGVETEATTRSLGAAVFAR